MRATLRDYRRAFGLLVKKAVRPAFVLTGQHTALLRRVAQAILDLCGSVPPTQTTNPSHILPPLTERETEVLRLMASGLSNDEIAAALHLSTCTVNNHRDHILRKLGLPSRTAAAKWYFQQLANLPAWTCLIGQTLSAAL